MSFYELFLITIILLPGILLMVFNEKDLYTRSTTSAANG